MSFDPEKFNRLTNSWKLVYLPETDSTNKQAKIAIEEGSVTSGSLFVTDFQSGGVGRRGSEWHAGKAENLLFSIVLETGLTVENIPKLSIASGVAIANSLSHLVDAKVKWPNDVFVGSNKIAGILVEHIDDFTVIGVGLNVNQLEYPEELAATSLKIETGELQVREKLLCQLADNILKWGSLSVVNFEDLKKSFEGLDYLAESEIQFISSGEYRQGIAKGINEQGELLVEIDGVTQSFHSIEQVRFL